jgi:hypothetical protein
VRKAGPTKYALGRSEIQPPLSPPDLESLDLQGSRRDGCRPESWGISEASGIVGASNSSGAARGRYPNTGGFAVDALLAFVYSTRSC